LHSWVSVESQSETPSQRQHNFVRTPSHNDPATRALQPGLGRAPVPFSRFLRLLGIPPEAVMSYLVLSLIVHSNRLALHKMAHTWGRARSPFETNSTLDPSFGASAEPIDTCPSERLGMPYHLRDVLAAHFSEGLQGSAPRFLPRDEARLRQLNQQRDDSGVCHRPSSYGLHMTLICRSQ